MRSDRVAHFIRVICHWLLGQRPQPAINSAPRPIDHEITRPRRNEFNLDCFVKAITQASSGALELVVGYPQSKGWGRTTLWLPSEIRSDGRNPQLGDEISVTARIDDPIPGCHADRFVIESWSVIAPSLATVSLSDGQDVPRPFLPLWPFWLWLLASSLTDLGVIDEWSDDDFNLGSLVWLSGHFAVICWHWWTSAARTDVRIGSYESRTSRARRYLAKTWRTGTLAEWFIATVEITHMLWLVPYLLFT